MKNNVIATLFFLLSGIAGIIIFYIHKDKDYFHLLVSFNMLLFSSAYALSIPKFMKNWGIDKDLNLLKSRKAIKLSLEILACSIWGYYLFLSLY